MYSHFLYPNPILPFPFIPGKTWLFLRFLTFLPILSAMYSNHAFVLETALAKVPRLPRLKMLSPLPICPPAGELRLAEHHHSWKHFLLASSAFYRLSFSPPSLTLPFLIVFAYASSSLQRSALRPLLFSVSINVLGDFILPHSFR